MKWLRIMTNGKTFILVVLSFHVSFTTELVKKQCSSKIVSYWIT